jgi:hypothetical protein
LTEKSKGFRLDLGEPLASDLADFCVAHFKAPATEVIREALSRFIQTRLNDEPAVRQRFEEARRARLGASGKNIRVLTTEKQSPSANSPSTAAKPGE